MRGVPTRPEPSPRATPVAHAGQPGVGSPSRGSTGPPGAGCAQHPAHARPRPTSSGCGPRRADRPARGRGGLPAAVAAAQPVRRAARGPARVTRRSSATAASGRRTSSASPGGGGRQVHDRPHPARAAVALAGHPRVELVTTDGFLLPNAELERAGLMQRKGFPESYDRRALLRFVADVKSGRAEVRAPVYSHLTYDIVPGERIVVRRPDILIVEGLNVLQPPRPGRRASGLASATSSTSRSTSTPGRGRPAAGTSQRFLRLRETAFADPGSYFHRYAALSDERGRPHRRAHLDDDQRRQPGRERAADAAARDARAGEGRRPRGDADPAAQAVTGPAGSLR